MTELGNYHPIVIFIYFLNVICYSMFIMHPVFLGISLISALCVAIVTVGKEKTGKTLFVALPVAVVAILINAVLNNEGTTILADLPSGAAITAEALYYGAAAAAMLVAIIFFFSAYNNVMTNDKFIYLFGKALPTLSLILSMIIRLLPLMAQRFKEIRNAQRAIANETGHFISKCKQWVKMLSILITWSLENAIDTSDSMLSRGFGSGKRTAYNTYTFMLRDALAFLWIVINSLIIISQLICGKAEYSYFPSLKVSIQGSLMAEAAYLFLCFTPVFMELREACRWKSIK